MSGDNLANDETNKMEVTITLNTNVLHSMFESKAEDLVGVFEANRHECDTNKVRGRILTELNDLKWNILSSEAGQSIGNESVEMESDLLDSTNGDLNNGITKSEGEHCGNKRYRSSSSEPLSKIPRTKENKQESEQRVNTTSMGVDEKQTPTPKIATTKGDGGGEGITGMHTPINLTTDKTPSSHTSTESPSEEKTSGHTVRQKTVSTKRIDLKKPELVVKRLSLSPSPKRGRDAPKTCTFTITPRSNSPHHTPLKRKSAKVRTPTSDSRCTHRSRCTGKEKLNCPVCSKQDCGKCKYCQ